MEKKIHSWINKKSIKNNSIANADAASLAPLLIREHKNAKKTLLAICPQMNQAEELFFHLNAWNSFLEQSLSILLLPETTENNNYIPENESARARALDTALNSSPDVICASISAFLAPVPPAEKLLNMNLLISKDMEIKFQDLIERLIEMDYDDELEVTIAGEFSRRGGIIDIFSPSEEYPARIEFWGDTVDSIRRFSPSDQKSTGEISSYRVISKTGIFCEESDFDFFDYVKESSPRLAVVFPEQCITHLERFFPPKKTERWESITGKNSLASVMRLLDPAESANHPDAANADCFPAVVHLRESLPDELEGGFSQILQKALSERIKQWQNTGYEICLTGKHKSSSAHIEDWLKSNEIPPEKISFVTSEIPCGVLFPSIKTVFITEKELFTASPHRTKIMQPLTKDILQAVPEEKDILDLEEGDLAVHIVHGIGKYHGIKEIKSQGAVSEVIVLEYAGDTTVYVPMHQAHLVSRYIGSKRAQTSLSRLGGKRWTKAKIEAERSVRDMALEMLKVQAIRSDARGHSFPEDDLWQRIFEEEFPFEDTPDQIKAAKEIKQDMISDNPMDRLLCGDVGYGKTEVAIRAVFKAVMSGKQVAILVPTTILAQQHYYNLSERFAEYPVIIEMLSRFRTRKEQKQIVEMLKEKKIDIIIGTHRMLQNDVDFAELGLVIIDEEQRFGVEHKEQFKKFRATVDVLTMTATPIPRTLYMAMTGVRDLSTIITAPGLRLPVKTIVAQHDEQLIVSAIEREVQRGGQVYYLHNRVNSIEKTCNRLRDLMPDVRFAIGHGRMHEDELETIMGQFLDGKIDVLVCTTIIESGLDIPNANTMIIERADRFGLAELYQLRGRVGRWKNQAYAYLLLPKDNILTGDARKRISAIRRYTHLGAGFRLALKDLEIRGAGNLLGAEQSGHINSVGFDLYCQLLRSTVSQLKGQSEKILKEIELKIDFLDFAHRAPDGHIAAGIPSQYLPSEKLRLGTFRRLSGIQDIEELDEFKNELADRFGPLPEQTENLIGIAKIKLLAAQAGFHSLAVKDGKIFFEDRKGFFKEKGSIPELDNKNTLPESKLKELIERTEKICKSR